MNIGFALLILKMREPDDVQSAIEILSYKLGGFSIYLGIMLFLNLFLFFRGKRKSAEHTNHRQLLNLSVPNEE